MLRKGRTNLGMLPLVGKSLVGMPLARCLGTTTPKTVRIHFNKRKVKFQTGVLAPLAPGSIVATDAKSVVLVTACKEMNDGTNLSLSVEYREKASAAGKIPDHVLRRELAPRQGDLLVARMIDRSIRPVFDKSKLFPTVQVICTTLAYDGVGDIPVLSVNAASLALTQAKLLGSEEQVACVRVSCFEDRGKWEYFDFPDLDELRKASDDWPLDMVVSGTSSGITFVDFSSRIPLEPSVLGGALDFAVSRLKRLIADRTAGYMKPLGIVCEVGTLETKPHADEAEILKLSQLAKRVLRETTTPRHSKLASTEIIDEFVDKLLEASATGLNSYEDQAHSNPSRQQENPKQVANLALLETVRSEVIDEEKRLDGRPLEQCRETNLSLNILPRVNGSATFSRGGSKSLCVATCGTAEEALEYLPYCGEESKEQFYVHYEFPPFAANKTGRLGFDRSMLMNGSLIQKAFLPVFPNPVDFPLSVRVNAEVLSGDGGTTMASVCGTSLALMNAGVPIKDHVAGVTIGLVGDKLLVDMNETEAQISDMCFRLTGTKDGITAGQLECKNDPKGIDLGHAVRAVEAADRANKVTIKRMNKLVSRPQEPRDGTLQVRVVSVPKGQVKAVLGFGGLKARELEASIDCTLECLVEEDLVRVFAKTEEILDYAEEAIKSYAWLPEIGDIFTDAEVVEVWTFGIVVQISPDTTGSVTTKELCLKTIDATNHFKVGDTVPVKVTAISIDNFVKLSRKEALIDLNLDDPILGSTRQQLSIIPVKARKEAKAKRHRKNTSSQNHSEQTRKKKTRANNSEQITSKEKRAQAKKKQEQTKNP
uniref:polyribonucleotide nucleotidyltransferase n=1 Tax=Mucochytrium quahogii TaxID=96639 RepID=A0A7S2S5U3_9STRA